MMVDSMPWKPWPSMLWMELLDVTIMTVSVKPSSLKPNNKPEVPTEDREEVAQSKHGKPIIQEQFKSFATPLMSIPACCKPA